MKPRGVLIAGNWKMNYAPRATEGFFSEFSALALKAAIPPGAFGPGKIAVWVIPPAVSLPTALLLAARTSIPVSIGAQNAHWEKNGAFTGELSGPMLLEIGVRDVLVGHSERRQYFGETDETVHKRAMSLLEQGLKVILCIGETRAEREGGKTLDVLKRQLEVGLGPEIAPFLDGRLVLAYEPVWAIGTGLTASPEQAEESHQAIRKFLWDRYGMEAAGRTLLLYGGSVTPENVDSLLACANVDGALVGGASLKPAGFLTLIQAAAKAV